MKGIWQQEQPGPEVQASECVKGRPGGQRAFESWRESPSQELHRSQITKAFKPGCGSLAFISRAEIPMKDVRGTVR